MSRKFTSGIILAVTFVILVGAGIFLANSYVGNHTSTNVNNSKTTVSIAATSSVAPQSNVTLPNGNQSSHNFTQSNSNSSQPTFSKLYLNQSISSRNFVVTLDRITSIGGQSVAILNVSTNFNFSRTIGQRQYSNLGALYLVVNQINTTGTSAWATVALSDTPPQSFSNSTFNGGNYSSYSDYQSNASPASLLTGMPTNLPACGSSNTIFTALPIPTSDIYNIYPLGAVNSHIYPTDHIYFELRKSGGVPVSTPLSSPGNLTIYRIAGARYKTSSGAIYNDYTLYFAGCNDFAGFFAHIYTISSKLLDNFTQPYSSCLNYTEDINGWGLTNISYCAKNTLVNVTTGEHLGTAGGVAGGSEALDFQTLDFRQTPLYFVNQTRNQGELYIACGLNYFASSLRNELYQYVGDYGRGGVFQKRTVSPLCGTIAQDIAGTAQGDWANPQRANASYPDADVFALIHDAVNPSMLTFSLGGGAIPGINSDIWLTFSTASSGYTNRAFSNVTADGHIYCYDNLQSEYGNTGFSGVILMQLLDANTIRMEHQDIGSCSTHGNFTSNHVDFYR